MHMSTSREFLRVLVADDDEDMRALVRATLHADGCSTVEACDGEELLVCDRDKPVARIVPCSAEDEPERERRLIARGIMTPPKKKRRPSLPRPAGNVSDEVMERVWREEREDR